MAGKAAVPPPAYRLVLIEWVDSMGGDGRWAPWEDGDDPEPVICRSVGRLVIDSERNKVVIPHWHEATDDRVKRSGCGDMTIPACAVVRMVDLIEA